MHFFPVHESKYGICNVYGTLHDCGVDSRSKCSRCTCKEGYFGARCQYCYNNPKYTIFEGINGTVQSVTWKGRPTLVAFGGRVGNQKTYWSSVEAWDDTKGTWSLLPDFNLNEPKMAFGFATLPTELLCSDMTK